MSEGRFSNLKKKRKKEVDSKKYKESHFPEDEQTITQSQTEEHTEIQTNTQTFGKTITETSVDKDREQSDVLSLFPAKVNLEKKRKRYTHYLDNEEGKIIERLSKKLKRQKYEIVAIALREMGKKYLSEDTKK